MKIPWIFEALANSTILDMRKFHDFPNSKNSEDSHPSPMGSVSSAERIIMPATREIVDKLIASDAVVIFSKTYCPYCKMAKEAFDKIAKKYTAIELDIMDDGDAIQDVLGEITGARSVPRVFVNGKFIGGGTDVKKMGESGELKQLCAA